MQENEIYNAKKELANLYLVLKNDSEKVILFYFLFKQEKSEEHKEELIKQLVEKKSLKELIEFIKSSISIIINIKLQEEIEKYINTQFNPAIEYELLLQKEEQTNREHIGIEHQFKIQCEKYAQELDSLEDEKSLLLIQIVSYIMVIYINIGIFKKRI